MSRWQSVRKSTAEEGADDDDDDEPAGAGEVPRDAAEHSFCEAPPSDAILTEAPLPRGCRRGRRGPKPRCGERTTGRMREEEEDLERRAATAPRPPPIPFLLRRTPTRTAEDKSSNCPSGSPLLADSEYSTWQFIPTSTRFQKATHFG